ncbi:MAG: hypothetical protein Q4G45_04930 [Actinomycetia bacterium]|nr:hypothetical protein [Actinomycetes bacterium]
MGRTLLVALLSLTLLLTSLPRAVAAPVPEAEPQATAPGTFVPLAAPVRVLDTRSGVGAPARRLGNQGTVRVGVSTIGVPASAAAVVVNVTAVQPTAPGFVTVYPWAGSVPPLVSNLNFVPGDVVPNLVVVKLGTSASVGLTASLQGTTDLVADVAGYYVGGTASDSGAFVPVSPQRLLDTRATVKLEANTELTLDVAGQAGVPRTGAQSVFVNVTATEPEAAGFLTLYPYGASRPTTSNVNFRAGQTVPNLASVKLGAGYMMIVNGSSRPVHVVLDVFGYVLGNGQPSKVGSFVPLTPSRTYDSRSSDQGIYSPAEPPVGFVFPPGVQAAVLNVTVTSPMASGYLVVYPGVANPSRPGETMCQSPGPTSNLNFDAGETVANLVVTATGGPSNAVCVRPESAAGSHFILDLAGVYVNPGTFAGGIGAHQVSLTSTGMMKLLKPRG